MMHQGPRSTVPGITCDALMVLFQTPGKVGGLADVQTGRRATFQDVNGEHWQPMMAKRLTEKARLSSRAQVRQAPANGRAIVGSGWSRGRIRTYDLAVNPPEADPR